MAVSTAAGGRGGDQRWPSPGVRVTQSALRRAWPGRDQLGDGLYWCGQGSGARTGGGPALRARLSVLAVPADIGACLAAVGDEQAERERDAAQRALGGLQRTAPGIARRGRR